MPPPLLSPPQQVSVLYHVSTVQSFGTILGSDVSFLPRQKLAMNYRLNDEYIQIKHFSPFAKTTNTACQEIHSLNN